MKKRFNYLLAIAMPLVLFASCAKEVVDVKDETPAEEVTEPSVKGRPVTIAAGLPAETKITHVYENSAVKPYWEAGDQIKVVFTLNAAKVEEVFTLATGDGTQSATFTNANSQLEDNVSYSVFYPATEESWAVQDGTLANLPEVLSATGLTLGGDAATLAPGLTYFHVVGTVPGTSGTFTSAYLSKIEGGFTMYAAPGSKGGITVTPSSAFTAGGSADFYIAVMLDGSTSANGTDAFGETVSPKLQLAFGNGVQGISADGQAFDLAGDSYKFSWSPAKAYAAGAVYKIANKSFTTTTAAQAMPR